jgi:positive regulator of sigma E activity
LLYSAYSVYVLPLLGLLFGAGLYTWQATELSDAWSLFSAILGMLTGMGLSRYLQSRQQLQHYQVLMLAIEPT